MSNFKCVWRITFHLPGPVQSHVTSRKLRKALVDCQLPSVQSETRDKKKEVRMFCSCDKTGSFLWELEIPLTSQLIVLQYWHYAPMFTQVDFPTNSTRLTTTKLGLFHEIALIFGPPPQQPELHRQKRTTFKSQVRVVGRHKVTHVDESSLASKSCFEPSPVNTKSQAT